MIKRKFFYIIPLFISMGCIASGISLETNSLVFTGGFFLLLSVTPYVYVPFQKKRKKYKAVQKFQVWSSLAQLTGLSYSMPEKEPYLPTLSGEYRGYQISMLPYLERLGNTKLIRQFTMIKIPIQNPSKLCFFIKDKEMLDSMFSFFAPSIHGASDDPRVEKRFTIKSNPERMSYFILQQKDIVESFLNTAPFRLEVLENSFILTIDGVQKEANTAKDTLDLAIAFINRFYEISSQYYSSYKVA